MKNQIQCEARTKKGKRCKNQAKEGCGGYCRRHKKQAAEPTVILAGYCPPEKSLFRLVVPEDKLNEGFNLIRTAANSEPARRMLDEIYQEYQDLDGNFLEQFQTTGFDNRVLELYLFAYFSRSGFEIHREYAIPDFMVERDGLIVAVEATTVNAPRKGVVKEHGRSARDVSEEDTGDFYGNEIPIRFGSPLFSKLNKKYWELEHCRDVPFVVVIEAFHERDAHWLSDASLINYLYGLKHIASWNVDGSLNIRRENVESHQLGEKVISSNFFGQEQTENISAVVFTNSATSGKFSRMGYHHGYGNDTVYMSRTGFWFNPQPFARDPTLMSFDLAKPPFVESWGQGLVVFHNPHCKHPVPREFFIGAVQGYVEDDLFIAEHADWHPITSQTISVYLGPGKRELDGMPGMQPRVAVGAISKDDFIKMCPVRLGEGHPFGDEHGWYADETWSFLGVVFHDNSAADWGYAVLGRNQHFVFTCVDVDSGITSRDQARADLQFKIAKLLASPQRIFPD